MYIGFGKIVVFGVIVFVYGFIGQFYGFVIGEQVLVVVFLYYEVQFCKFICLVGIVVYQLDFCYFVFVQVGEVKYCFYEIGCCSFFVVLQ